MQTKEGLMVSLSKFTPVKGDLIQMNQLSEFRDLVVNLEEEIENHLTPSAERTLALRKLQETFHWIEAAIREDRIKRMSQPESQPDGIVDTRDWDRAGGARL